jgi:hypothetical protein
MLDEVQQRRPWACECKPHTMHQVKENDGIISDFLNGITGLLDFVGSLASISIGDTACGIKMRTRRRHPQPLVSTYHQKLGAATEAPV